MKDAYNLHPDNSKTLLTEITESPNKWRGIQYSWIESTKNVMRSVLPRFI